MATVNVQISTIGTDAGPFTINDGYTNVATGVTRLALLGGIQVTANDLATQLTVTATSGNCVGTQLIIPIDFHPCGTGPGPTPTPPPAAACYISQTGVYPVSGGAGSASTGTITVTGSSVNVWAKYNTAGSTSGTAIYSMTINSVNANGSDTITSSGQTFYSSQGGSNSNGYITLTPGTYNYTLTKTDNLTSGNSVRFSWSTGTNAATSTEMTACATPPPTPQGSNWTIRNASCGFGYIYDVGINGYFMGNLEGPSNFPLTSTLYGYKTNPNGITYGSPTNSIQINVTTNLPGTGNCGYVYIFINGNPSPSYSQQFTFTPYIQIDNVQIDSGDQVELAVYCYQNCQIP